eukprot:CAMPEP_0170355102 /NCGR_PEP_ID=MMETSP0117_2-20130122/467_1 /TAXON_ID=400756 /ORGANISM="Durinskia baltica, Strain CSIRO CS-38" /LENGTH=507 /DNA_ID=CAMNT_0010609125 /DNA_START=48 /DNA_END=1568 /DNA_ORIENTATION=+
MTTPGNMADEYGTMNSDGETMVFDEFTLECGRILKNVEARYRTWGTLNASGDNLGVVCHALTGNANLEAWWSELLGEGKALDTSKYFIFCSNVLGGCYGTTGPTSINPETGMRYGGDFPPVTIRDMVRLQAEVVKRLGATLVAFVLGGSMGGMQALEWGMCDHMPVGGVISLCASGRHHPWQIGISECQRQAIFADPLWQGGRYPPDLPPERGLGVARMMAMLTYRTHPAYWTKFGRQTATAKEDEASPAAAAFEVEQYLRHQGKRFQDRGFDAASYVTLTRAMDSHDLARGRGDYLEVLKKYATPTLVASISSDVLYPVEDQLELARHMPCAQHHLIQSDEGHDGFLLEHVHVGTLVRGFLSGLQIRRGRRGATSIAERSSVPVAPAPAVALSKLEAAAGQQTPRAAAIVKALALDDCLQNKVHNLHRAWSEWMSLRPSACVQFEAAWWLVAGFDWPCRGGEGLLPLPGTASQVVCLECDTGPRATPTHRFGSTVQEVAPGCGRKK